MIPTKEERDQWRERLLSHLPRFDAEYATFTIRLLNALNQAEEDIARLEQEAFFWREETKDVRELFTRQLGYKDVEIARLEREADWLIGEKIVYRLNNGKFIGALNATKDGYVVYPTKSEAVISWREAARRAVEEER